MAVQMKKLVVTMHIDDLRGCRDFAAGIRQYWYCLLGGFGSFPTRSQFEEMR